MNLIKVSKYLCFLLRHKPESIGLNLDNCGWVDIAELISKSEDYKLTHEILTTVVETDDKQRFVFSDDGTKMRANQGHSIGVDLDLKPIEPPAYLYHGTAERFLEKIMSQGVQKGQRHHVHLTENKSVARDVGARYGKPVILTVNSSQMHKDGVLFYRTANCVWLADEVSCNYVSDVEVLN